MARIEADKTVNATQLCVELGRVPLEVNGRTVSSDAVSEADLRAAVEAHVADPDYVDPDAPPPSVEQMARQRLAELKAKGWQNLTASEKAEVAQRVLEAIA